MTKELKRSQCLTSIYGLVYQSNPELCSLGRYIKALRYEQSLLKDPLNNQQYDSKINNLLQQHIIYLQEAVLSFKHLKTKTIDRQLANKIKNIASSQFSVSDDKYSLVDIDGLKKIKLIKNAVVLKDNLVLPCKVKSDNGQFKFVVQIVMTKDNVLLNSKNNFEFDYSSSNVNHYTLLTKVGKGITTNELKPKSINLAR